MSEDMSPYCSAHEDWLIMKLCMYVGYHDPIMVVTQFSIRSIRDLMSASSFLIIGPYVSG